MKKSMNTSSEIILKPSPKVKIILFLRGFFGIFIFIVVLLFTLLPILGFSLVGFLNLIMLGLLIAATLSLIWARLYYRSIVYILADNEIIWKRGVLYKNTGIVPYDKITNIDIVQDPISRLLGIADLSIQTAGYSGKVGAELAIVGLENYEEVKELILSLVKRKKSMTKQTQEQIEDVNVKILDELVKIRKLLEKLLSDKK